LCGNEEIGLCIVSSWLYISLLLFSLSLPSAGNGDPALDEADDGEEEIDDVHDEEGDMVVVKLQKRLVIELDLLQANLGLVRAGQEVHHVDEPQAEEEVEEINRMAKHTGALLKETHNSYRIQRRGENNETRLPGLSQDPSGRMRQPMEIPVNLQDNGFWHCQ